MKLKIFKRKKVFKKDNHIPNVDFFWEIILSVSFVLALLSFAFGFYIFMKINKEPILPISGENGVEATLSEEKINKALEFFSRRRERSFDIINSPSPVVDPSL